MTGPIQRANMRRQLRFKRVIEATRKAFELDDHEGLSSGGPGEGSCRDVMDRVIRETGCSEVEADTALRIVAADLNKEGKA